MTKAAVMAAPGEPLEVRDIDVNAPRSNEVQVRLAASGVCHSDLTIHEGLVPLPLPLVLGHEGAGVVTEVGEGVERLAVGDHVVLSATARCGTCYFCERGLYTSCETGSAVFLQGGLLDGTPGLTLEGQPLHQMSFLGTFAEETVVPDVCAVKVRDDIPLDVACLIGCAVVTGYGAAANAGNIRTGDVVAVAGCGGVGLNTVQGAAISGAGTVIAIDINDSKLELAQTLGATEVVNARNVDPVERVFELTGGRGADVAFETAGTRQTAEQVLAMTRAAGRAVFVGGPDPSETLSIPIMTELVMPAKTLHGSLYGSGDILVDFPRLADLYMDRTLRLDELISRRVALDEVNDSFAELREGTVARSVIVFDGPTD